MCRCWHSEPKLRPSFGALKLQLEMILARLSLLSSSQDPLYVNIGKPHGVSWNGPSTDSPFGMLDSEVSVSGAAAVAVTSDYRYIVSPLCLGNDAESERHPDASEGEASSLLYDLDLELKQC